MKSHRTYVQFELRQRDARMFCWLHAEKRLREGVEITLKGIKGRWLICRRFTTVLWSKPKTEWKVGGLM